MIEALFKYYSSIARRTVQDADTIKGYTAGVAEWMRQSYYCENIELGNDVIKRFLILCGSVGTGKTTLMRSIQRFCGEVLAPSDAGFQIGSYSAVDVCEMYKHKFEDFEDVKIIRQILFLDDVGEEPGEVNSYGNYATPIRDLLMYCYETDKPVVMTTNLTPQAIAKRYGERLADRFKETAKVIVINGQSYRK